ncbi:MAG: sigma-70 family RNA polymerase sigma factor [Pirellulaceae bacterium]|nr:sigma-70 family RNA polymerase sigma factor [Pirellulaceae bacterium]
MKNQFTASDADLVSASQQGDTTAFGQLVVRYQSLACSVAYNRCGDFAASEDCAQEAFLSAWKNLSSLREASDFKAWICTIVRNLATRIRSRRKELPSVDISSIETYSASTTITSDPERALLAAELGELVWSALKEIPENYREPLILFYREDKSVARVANALGISEDAAKQRLARGRKMLHAQMIETVENVLETTKPNPHFASAVLSCIVGAGKTTASATGSIAATATAYQSSAALFWLPLANLPVVAWTLRLALKEARSDRERDMVVKHLVLCTLGLIPMSAMMFGSILLTDWPRHPVLKALVIPGIGVLYLIPLVWSSILLGRRVERLREEESTASPPKDFPLNTGTNAAQFMQFMGSAWMVAACPVLWLALTQQWALALLAFVAACGLATLGFSLRGSQSVRSMRVYGITLASVAVCMIGIAWLNLSSSFFGFAACIQASALSFAVLQLIAWRRVHGR